MENASSVVSSNGIAPIFINQTIDDFRVDAQTGHVTHETPKQFRRIFENEKKNHDFILMRSSIEGVV